MSADLIPPDRLPPQSKEAEMGVIGSVLRDNQVLNDVQQIIRVDNFYYDAHQKIFQAVSDTYNEGKPVDLVILHEVLKQRKQLEDVGGVAYLAELWDAAPTAANAEYYARIVREKAVIRNVIHATTELLRDAYDGVMAADELLGAAERKVLEIAEKGTVGETKSLKDALGEAFDRIDSRMGKTDLSLSGIPTGFLDLDNLTAGFQNSELIIVAARPSVGKCLTADAEILLGDGSVVTIRDIYRRGRASLLTLGDDWKFRPAAPSAFVDDGRKPVFRVRTRLGRVIETTASHPFRAFDGWTPLAGLKAGDWVAVPRRLPVFGSEPMRECEVKILGYLIGDGGLTDTTPEFTNPDPRVRADFEAAVREFGGVTTRVESSGGTRTPTVCVSGDPAVAAGRAAFGRHLRTALGPGRGAARRLAAAVGVSPASVTHWTRGRTVPDEEMFRRVCTTLGVGATTLTPDGYAAARKNGKNPLTVWLEGLGLWGRPAREKFVPEPVFRLPRPQLAMFLNRLFATDGWATLLAGGQTQLGFASASERLARQVQHLLLRFGVIGRLRRRAIAYRGGRRPCWQLDITDGESIRAFAAEVGIFGKEDALGRVTAGLARKRPKATRDVIPPMVWERLAAAKGDRSWSAVAALAGLPNRTNLHVGTRGLSRRRLARLAAAVGDETLGRLAESDVYWDRIVSIEPVGVKQVYDLTIPDTHNFVANDVCVHNTAFALNLVRHAIVEERIPVFFVSLEQARIELAERLLACQSRVDSFKIRKGNLTADDIQRLMTAGDQLKGTHRDPVKLFIDDTPSQTMLRIAANARRLKLRHDLRLVVIDYLQLIEPENRRDPRQEQVAQISRRLKFLARELKIPVIALAQVNRASEDRQDHKPRLADLRESGCLTGDTLVPLADTGDRVPIRDLVGKTGFAVWALNEATYRLERAGASRAFPTGRKPVFRLETRLGRVVRATANHPFRAFAGWKRLDELIPGDRIAVPRRVPCDGHAPTVSAGEAGLLGLLIGDGCTLPRHAIQYTTADADLADRAAELATAAFGDRVRPRVRREREWYQVYLSAADKLTHGKRNPVAEWLDRLGVFGLRSFEKRVPDVLFRQPPEIVGAFLRHLWATDGCIRAPRPGGKTRHPAVYYASSSERLARDVQALLLRLGINAVLRPRDQKGKGRVQYHTHVMGHKEITAFADGVGAVGCRKQAELVGSVRWLNGRPAVTNRDVIPRQAWPEFVVPAMRRNGVSMRAMQAGVGMAYAGSALYKANVGRERLARVERAVGGDPTLAALADSDVYWDEVRSITPDGVEDVFDLTVPGPHNFVANDVVVHNSIEQDADTCLMLHRPGKFDGGVEDNVLEVIVAKQRNGPTGEVTLAYLKQYMRYENYAADLGPGGNL